MPVGRQPTLTILSQIIANLVPFQCPNRSRSVVLRTSRCTPSKLETKADDSRKPHKFYYTGGGHRWSRMIVGVTPRIPDSQF